MLQRGEQGGGDRLRRRTGTGGRAIRDGREFCQQMLRLGCDLRGLFSNVDKCATERASEARPVAYQDAESVISAGAASAAGWSVAIANLKGYRCDGPADDTAFPPQTFAISSANDARYLRAWLQLLDASDVDSNGQSDVVFMITSVNRGGHDLIYNDFAA